MNRMDYSMGLFVYYFGSKKQYKDVAHHTIFFGNSYEKHLEKIFEKKTLSEDISYYLHRPSATDPNMAPKNQDAFYVLFLCQTIYQILIGQKKVKNLKILF